MTAATTAPAMRVDAPAVAFTTEPSGYRHWRLQTDGSIATLTLAVDPHAGLVPGYELKMNSYDLGVDIELYGRRPAPALRASGSESASW